jgi:beta-galactosidase
LFTLWCGLHTGEFGGGTPPVRSFTLTAMVPNDEGELFLNGKSLGRKKKGPFEYRLRWNDVVYEPGTLKVN